VLSFGFGFVIKGVRFKVRDLEFRVRGLRFQVWVFWIPGLGLMV